MPNIYDKITEAKRLIAELEEKEGYAEFMAGRKGLVKPFGSYQTKEHQFQIELKAEDRAFLRFIRTGEKTTEFKALVEDSTGLQLVSPAIDDELHRAVADLVVVRALASVKQTTKPIIKVRTIDEATVAYGKLEVGAEITEGTPVPAEVDKFIEDMNGLVKIGMDQLEDSDHDLYVYIVGSFSRAVSNLENKKFLYGGGHTVGEPEGLCVDATLVANAVETAAVGAITIEDALDCVYAVKAQYRKGSSWIVNSLTELELRKLRSESTTGVHEGAFLWQPSTIAGAPPTFLGYPIHTCDEMGTLAGTEEILAVFGNLSLGYRIYDRRGITVEMLREIYREAGLYGYVLHARNTGFPIRPGDKRVVLLKEAAA